MPRDLSDKAQVSKLEKSARVVEHQHGTTVRGLMNNGAGRHWMHDILVTCHIFQTSFDQNALRMAFREGERSRGLELLSYIMRYCPEQYVLMMREANARDAATERTISENGNRGTEASSLDDGTQLDLYSEFDSAVKSGTVRLAIDDDYQPDTGIRTEG